MVRRGPDDWAAQVCRDWEAVLEAWKARESEDFGAVLHIGFDRPASIAFENIAAEHPRKMLFTAAAKYAVPPSFDSSTFPLGHVEGIPVHLALRGWGYVEDDAVVKLAVPNMAQSQFSGWVAQFAEARPDCAEAMLVAGVTDEASYLKYEGAMDWEPRYRSGLYRYGFLIAGDEDDPCAIARAAPPWLSSRSFENIEITVRLGNVFERAQIGCVADLGLFNLNELSKKPNFGRKSANDLKNALLSAMSRGPLSDDKVGDGGVDLNTEGYSGSKSLLAEIHRTLALCDERERDILNRRMGLGRPAETLQSIAEDYGITRERIRQLEAKATKRIIRQENWDDVLTAKIEKLLADRQFPLPILGLEAVDGWFDGVARETEAFVYSLANFCGDRVSKLEIGGIQYIGFLSQDEWNGALSEATKILAYASDKGWDEAHLKNMVFPTIPEKAREFRPLMWENICRLAHFSDAPSGERILVSYGRGADHAVEAILYEAERPLHYSEIAERLQARSAKPIDERRVHNAAANIGILLGRGTFGIERHIAISSEELGKISDEGASIILSGPFGRQWHASEILGNLIERGFESAAIDKYVVDYALTKAVGLQSMGRMAWKVADDTNSAGSRLEVREAVLSLLMEAGMPLSAPEIIQRLVALRGVNDTVQLVSGDPLIRIGGGLWGLNDRDVPIKRKDQPALFDAVATSLSMKGMGIHISEFEAQLPPPLTPKMLFSLASLDERLKVSPGQYIYLREWQHPRRLTVSEACEEILRSEALSFDELCAQVHLRVGRQCDRGVISSSLQSIGATFGGDNLWRHLDEVEAAE